MDITVTLRLDLSPALQVAIDRALTAIGATHRMPTTPATLPTEGAIPPEPTAATFAPDEAEGKRWTPERLAILDDAYPLGIARPAILRAINARPGAAVTMGQMGSRATKRGLRRPTDQPPLAAPEPPVVPEPPVAPEPSAQAPAVVPPVFSPPPQRAIAEELVADDATIRHWAAQRGLCNGGEPLNLDRINAKRAQFGLPLFARRNGLRASSSTLRPGAP